MWWLIQMVLFGHIHKRKIIREGPLHYEGNFSFGTTTQYTCQCETCGTIRKFR